MNQKHFKPRDILDLFEIKSITKQSLINYEEKGEIPKAHRENKGKVPSRFWTSDQLPAIGSKLGFLKQPRSPKVLTTFSQKGGGLKSSITHALGRALALHGIKTIIIGTDNQRSITTLLKKEEEIEDFSQLHEMREKGLHHFFFEGSTLEEVIQKTDIPTLDFIPETPELTFLERKLRTDTPRREYLIYDKLLPKVLMKGYQVVLIDCSPTWGSLTEAAITASQFVLCPIEAYTGGYFVVDYNLKNIREFSEAMKHKLDGLFLIPTLTDSSKLSTQILSHYISAYKDTVVPFSIRRSVVGAECGFVNLSPMEYSPKHQLSEDYRRTIKYIWDKILATEGGN